MTSDTSFVFENLALLPIQEQQTYLKEGFVGLCTGGRLRSICCVRSSGS